MSWTRWGSSCDNAFPPHPSNDACKDCPGSDVYVYESDRGFECCGDDFICKTSDEMKEHLREHVKKGDHVRPSLLLTDEEYIKGLEDSQA